MTYGTIKVDTVTFTNAGVDKSVTLSGLVQNPVFSGNVTVTGTLSGVTVTGTTANFTSGNFTNISGGTHTITSGVFAAGSAASPSITFTGDLNTGIYSPGADQVAISTGGSGRLFVDASGNVSVGTTATSGFGRGVSVDGTTFSYYDLYADGTILGRVRSGLGQMNVLAQGASTDLILGTQNTERLRITSAGLVGVGTSSPSSLVHIAGGGSGRRGALRFSDSGGTNFWEIGRDNGVNGSFTITQNGTERLCIDYLAGNVGIGTTGPTATVHANSGSASDVYFRSSNSLATSSLGTAADGSTYVYNSAAYPVTFSTNATERARIDSSGRLLVGTSSNDSNALAVVQGYVGLTSGQGVLALRLGTTRPTGADVGIGSIRFESTSNTSSNYHYASISAFSDGASSSDTDIPGRLVFSTTADGASSPTERVRITNYGGTFFNTTGTPTVNANFGVTIGQFNGGARAGTLLTSADFDGTYFIAAFHGTVGYAQIMGDGDLENTNNRYTGISDIKFKQNVEDASSQWNDLKAIRVRKYELIANPDRKHIGCVAQELEQVCPGLVVEREGSNGDSYKSVAYSVLYMKAVKALQEAMERIETLEAKVAALESA